METAIPGKIETEVKKEFVKYCQSGMCQDKINRDHWQTFSDDLKDLINTIDKDRKAQIGMSAVDILRHPWLQIT